MPLKEIYWVIKWCCEWWLIFFYFMLCQSSLVSTVISFVYKDKLWFDESMPVIFCMENTWKRIISFHLHIKEVPLVAILTRNTSSNFFPWVFVNMWVQFLKKTACYRPLKNGHFIRVCTERMMDHQYGGNGARNVYPNYNQMRAYVECPPNQQKKLYLIDLSSEQSTKLWRFRKSAGRFCIGYLLDYCSSALPAHAYKMVIATVCVQMDNCFCNTWIIVHQHASLRWFRGTLLSAI